MRVTDAVTGGLIREGAERRDVIGCERYERRMVPAVAEGRTVAV